MTWKHVLYLSVSLFMTAGMVLAQQPSAPAIPAEPPMAAEPFGAFQLLTDGGGFLGVYAEDVNKENMAQYGLRDTRGVGVTEVVKDSPAEKAGLRKGDVILRLDGEAVSSVRKLDRLVSEVAPDHKVSLSISRGGAEQEVSVAIGKRPGYSDTLNKIFIPHFPGVQNFPGIEGQSDGAIFSNGNSRRIGIGTTPLTKQLAEYFGVTDGKGVLVTSVSEGSPAARAGIKAGDVITAVDGEKVESSGDLSRAISKQKDGDVTLIIVRDKSQRTLKVTPEKPHGQLLRPGGVAGRIVIPQIELGTIPAVNVTVPRIELPAIPEIDVSMPQVNLPNIPEIRVVVPKVKVIKTGQRVLI